jgi:hypothetical protein
MINENALRDVLVNLAEISKNQYSLIVDLTAEVAAMEKTMRALDPTFADTFGLRRSQPVQKVLASSKTVLLRYDNLILKMTAGLVS